MLGLLQRLKLKAPRTPKPVQAQATVASSVPSQIRVAGITPGNLRTFLERIPICHLAVGRITESDLALAATTPILGQYAPTFGWPDL